MQAAAEPSSSSLAYIMTMTRELKQIAHKAGYVQLALQLEMAELEAGDAAARGRAAPLA